MGVFSELCDQVMEQAHGEERGVDSIPVHSKGDCPHIQEHLIYLKAKVGQKPQEVGKAMGAGTQSRLEAQNPKPLLEAGEGWNDFSS